MSNTLEETLKEILTQLTVHSVDPYNLPTAVNDIKTVLHRVCLGVIGGDEDDRYFKDYSSDEILQGYEEACDKESRNELREEQRQRLSKLTGIEGSKEQ